MKIKVALCIIAFLIGAIIGGAIKKTATPLFSWGNEELDLKVDQYK